MQVTHRLQGSRRADLLRIADHILVIERRIGAQQSSFSEPVDEISIGAHPEYISPSGLHRVQVHTQHPGAVKEPVDRRSGIVGIVDRYMLQGSQYLGQGLWKASQLSGRRLVLF